MPFLSTDPFFKVDTVDEKCNLSERNKTPAHISLWKYSLWWDYLQSWSLQCFLYPPSSGPSKHPK